MRMLGLFLLACTAAGQDRPQFVWQGQVDGIGILYLHANRLVVQIKEGAPIEQQQFHFYHALPEIRQDAKLSVIEGRGYVHIIAQPRLDNQYTLGIEIQDRQMGSSFYSIAVNWDASDRFFEKPRGEGRSEKITWNGRVDEEAVVSCQSKTCVSSSTRGVPVAAERFKFSRPLPNQAMEVTLEQPEGRGEIRLVEQPSERNHYTARVSIRDPQSGASDYSFTLVWNRSNAKEPEPPPLQAARGLTWSAGVDGRVRVTVKSGACVSQVIQGGPVEGERAEFSRPLPSRSDLHPVLKKLRGRGRAEIVEYPSEANNYQLVFEIEDAGPGASSYEIELDW